MSTPTPLARMAETISALWTRAAPGADPVRSGAVFGAGSLALILWLALGGPAESTVSPVVFPLAEDTGAIPPEGAFAAPPALADAVPDAPNDTKTLAAGAPLEELVPAKAEIPVGSKSETVASGPIRTAPRARNAYSGDGLAPAPDIGLIAESPHGFLPRIGADGRTPHGVYARPFTDSYDRPRIAIVLRGIGLHSAASSAAIDSLPPEIAFSVAPIAERPQRWVNRARAAGHEVLLGIAMEPYGFPDQDPGPHALLTRMPEPELIERLHRQLARTTGYVGVMNHQGSAYLASPRDLRPVFEDLAGRGLLFLEDGTDERGLWSTVAAKAGLAHGAAALQIDKRPSRRAVDLALLELEATARTQGQAIGTARGLPVTVEQILAWAPTLAAKGLVLAPVSAMMGPSSPTKEIGSSHAALDTAQ